MKRKITQKNHGKGLDQDRIIANRAAKFRVPIEQLRLQVPTEGSVIGSTSELNPLEGTIGQERAIRALEFGLNVNFLGYNIFLAGLPGTGRNTTLSGLVRTVAADLPTPGDWCYLYNFRDPIKPLVVSLPNGVGKGLSESLKELLQEFRKIIPTVFEGAVYQQEIQAGMIPIENRHQEIIESIRDKASTFGVIVDIKQEGIVASPVTQDGQPMISDQLRGLSEQDRQRIEMKMKSAVLAVQKEKLQLRELAKEAEQIRKKIRLDLIFKATEDVFEEFRGKYETYPQIQSYIEMLRVDLVENAHLFANSPDGNVSVNNETDGSQVSSPIRYDVNLFVTHIPGTGAPIIFEDSPSYYNMFGRLEHALKMGAMSTNFMQIRAGSMHKANGGFLVIQAKDLLANPYSWQALKQSFRSQRLRIENLGEQFSSLPVQVMEPDAIPLDVKVILVGSSHVFQALLSQDEDFTKFFKVKAEFDSEVPVTFENIGKYASFITKRVRDDGLKHFSSQAVSKVIEHSSRIAEDQRKLTAKFALIAELLVEANYWADRSNKTEVTESDVRLAIYESKNRVSMIEDKFLERHADRTVNISVEGWTVGQVNGLAVLDTGDYSFGRPSRLTARVSVGTGDVSYAEKESSLSGPIHSKGFQILLGYIRGKYGAERVLPITGSIAFEQTYGEIDGDSASSAELYALLSSLAGVPIDQGLAVTGSIDQRGEVQAVGGVTQKVEGFYRVCVSQGLNGRQGVLIPKANINNLVLNDEVIDAVKASKFHLYAVSHIEEGVELLTNIEVGKADTEGNYETGTLNYLIHQSLDAFSSRLAPPQRTGSTGV